MTMPRHDRFQGRLELGLIDRGKGGNLAYGLALLGRMISSTRASVVTCRQ